MGIPDARGGCGDKGDGGESSLLLSCVTKANGLDIRPLPGCAGFLSGQLRGTEHLDCWEDLET